MGVAGAAIIVGGSVAGGIIGSKASKKAAKNQAKYLERLYGVPVEEDRKEETPTLPTAGGLRLTNPPGPRQLSFRQG